MSYLPCQNFSLPHLTASRLRDRPSQPIPTALHEAHFYTCDARACVPFQYSLPPLTMNRIPSATHQPARDPVGSDFDIFGVFATEGKNSSTWESDIGPANTATRLSSQPESLKRNALQQYLTHASQPLKRPTPQRKGSNSNDELQSRYHKSLVESLALRDELNVRNLYLGLPTDRCARLSSMSDPELRGNRQNALVVPQPLRTCLKHKETLRRTKTVDFEESMKQESDQPVDLPKKVVHIEDERTCKQPPLFPQSRTTARRKASYYSVNKAKSTPANPAMTRADVHVIATTPSRRLGCIQSDGSYTATPTRQIVESTSGSHETVWKNVTAESTIAPAHRNSSARNSLQAFSPASTRSLQRINTKLTDWSGSRLTDWVGT